MAMHLTPAPLQSRRTLQARLAKRAAVLNDAERFLRTVDPLMGDFDTDLSEFLVDEHEELVRLGVRKS